ncbi:hypothetical protein BKA81DRAFT_81202 [Phyllosticta paracitricarpa]
MANPTQDPRGRAGKNERRHRFFLSVGWGLNQPRPVRRPAGWMGGWVCPPPRSLFVLRHTTYHPHTPTFVDVDRCRHPTNNKCRPSMIHGPHSSCVGRHLSTTRAAALARPKQGRTAGNGEENILTAFSAFCHERTYCVDITAAHAVDKATWAISEVLFTKD